MKKLASRAPGKKLRKLVLSESSSSYGRISSRPTMVVGGFRKLQLSEKIHMRSDMLFTRMIKIVKGCPGFFYVLV